MSDPQIGDIWEEQFYHPDMVEPVINHYLILDRYPTAIDTKYLALNLYHNKIERLILKSQTYFKYTKLV